MGEAPEPLRAARDAFRRHDWSAAFELYRAAGEVLDLEADDAFALAESAWWWGEIGAALEAWEQAHDQYRRAGQPGRAAMSAMFIAAHSMTRGDAAAGSGWMSRMHRLLSDEPEGPEHGYPIYFEIFGASSGGTTTGRSPLPSGCWSSVGVSTTPTWWLWAWWVRVGHGSSWLR